MNYQKHVITKFHNNNKQKSYDNVYNYTINKKMNAMRLYYIVYKECNGIILFIFIFSGN